MKIDKSVQITALIVGGILILALIANSFFSSLSPSQNSISVNGMSTVKTIPDIITVNFNLETRGDSSERATSLNSEKMEILISEMKKLGFERNEIQTINFNVYEDYVWSGTKRNANGYIASHAIKISLSANNSELVGKVIDAGVFAGAGISYINYELSSEKENELKAEAIKLAAQDAKVKAEAVAEGIDKRLGKLVSISVQDFNYYPWPLYSGKGIAEDVVMAREASTNIVPSEQEISASVQAVYKIN